MKTIGISPKVIGSALAVVVGLVLYLTGSEDFGAGVLLAGLASLGVGVLAGPGTVAKR